MMKYSIKLYLTSILLIGSQLFAQEATSVTETSATIDDASGNAFRTIINRATEKQIAKEWKSLMKDSDGDVDIKGNEVLAKEVKIDAISGREITVFAQINKLTETTKEFLVMFLNGDLIVSSNNDVSGYTAANLMVKEFSARVSKEATNEFKEEQIAASEKLAKEMEDLKKDNENAKEDIEDAEKDIEKAKETIKEKEYALEENKKEQETMLKKIEEQKGALKKANDEAAIFN